MRLGSSSLIAVLAVGCAPQGGYTAAVDDASAADFVLGDVSTCAAPTAGIDRLVDVSANAGFQTALPHSTERQYGPGDYFPSYMPGLVASDLDEDGDLDLLTWALEDGAVAWLNDGQAHFVEQPIEMVGAVDYKAMTAVDLDGDRVPEIVTARGGSITVATRTGDWTWSVVADLGDTPAGRSPVFLTVVVADLVGDDALDIFVPSMEPIEGPGPGEGVFPGGPDLLFEGDGALGFAPAIELVAPADGSRSQVAVATDVDRDGDRDLFVFPDQGPPIAFYENDGPATSWVDTAPARGVDVSMAAMGVDSFDFNDDGVLDYCLSDVGLPKCFVSDGAGGWFEAGQAMGIAVDEWLVGSTPDDTVATIGWAVDLADLDADGWPELLQASGPEPGAIYRGFEDIPDAMWRGLPGGAFEEVSAAVGFDDRTEHNGVVTADFDGDGFLEVVRAGQGEPVLFEDNPCSAGSWLQVELEGPAANTEGIGARVEVAFGGRRVVREVYTLRNRAQGPSRVHVGLGEVDLVDELVVTWPDGTIQSLTDLPARRLVTALHPDAVVKRR